MSEAESFYRESLERSRRSVGEDHPLTVDKINSLASVLIAEGKLGDAERYLRETLEKRRIALGENHPFTLSTMVRLGWDLGAQGKLGEAETNLRVALDKSRRALGDDAPTTVHAITVMGGFLRDNNKLSEAEPYLREALNTSRRALGPDDRFTLYAIAQMGELLVAQGKFAEAEKLLAPLEAQAHGAAYRDNADVLATSMMSLGMARTGLAEFTVAEPDLLWAQPILVRWNGPNGKVTRKCTQALVDLYKAWNTAQPGRGHDAKSAEWKRKLGALGAPAAEATAH
jgi:tetratricopeptide (TPR) repeat protein